MNYDDWSVSNKDWIINHINSRGEYSHKLYSLNKELIFLMINKYVKSLESNKESNCKTNDDLFDLIQKEYERLRSISILSILEEANLSVGESVTNRAIERVRFR